MSDCTFCNGAGVLRNETNHVVGLGLIEGIFNVRYCPYCIDGMRLQARSDEGMTALRRQADANKQTPQLNSDMINPFNL